MLLRAGASRHVSIGDCTSILHVALSRPDASVLFPDMDELVRNEPELVNESDVKGWSPLHYCAQIRALDIARVLIDRGADVNVPDHRGRTPMTILLSLDADDAREPLYDLLKSHGAQCAEIEGQAVLSDPADMSSSPVAVSYTHLTLPTKRIV